MSEWIKCDFALPDAGRLVLVAVGGRVIPAYRRSLQYHKNPDKCAKWNGADYRVIAEPTHWMPLPSPPV